MLCRRCLQRSLRSPSILHQRTYATTLINRSNTSPSPEKSLAFSTPVSPPGTTITQITSKTKSGGLPVSITPSGTELQGLNYLKGRTDPIALEEKEYPEWLWHCLDKKAEIEGEEGVGDEFSKSKKQRRVAAKRQRKLEARLLAAGNTEALAPKIPLHQQTIDLPSNPENTAEGALEAVERREELRKAMRGDRRSKIKEANFLKGMK